jgi:hypothetical protein
VTVRDRVYGSTKQEESGQTLRGNAWLTCTARGIYTQNGWMRHTGTTTTLAPSRATRVECVLPCFYSCFTLALPGGDGRTRHTDLPETSVSRFSIIPLFR